MATARDVCIVFADVCGSTQLYETLGDAAALSAVDLCVGSMARATLLNRGRVVKTLGDEVMAVFDSAAQGMQTAIEMQQRIDAMPAPFPGVKLAIRAGFCFGPALLDNDDIFGDTVNTAARLAGLAKAGQIITTAETVAVLPELLRPSCRAIDAWAVKGKSGKVNVCEVIWQEDVDLTMMSARMAPATPTNLHLRLLHGGNELILSPAHPRVMLGRDMACDIAIRDPRASRSHARIECRRDKFVLVDLSSNGTFVTVQGEVEFSLRREEAILRGSGRIVFGHAWSALADTEILEYSIES
ncbi:MAG: adenylate/guanylate cyclase domain-containing protein [Gammaproteobacteria bacterium]|nr:adenylate/guanylate cyclase domain-containing protein [Rhodocyclaceae bacterium]MBU3909333.1 adenylate/guanylate cyclase domain-containing protein [Gammaproteobacteria bacterium]MBU3988719.1 adenylate/guanylate cyclase domain-containing protein [Gammaproteobacteria bacterium]MBU4005507.1 adenylate/guanylate cyclase domain-containing protein [Gammaproteobacteria bacterium]MBU4020940.1 adenylate/guanylate cyclase domain-containing protein [Gammaproteobacteria bacterium]